jgi:predicted ester cyclase
MIGCMPDEPDLSDRERSVEIVERFIADIMLAGDLDAIDELVSPDYVAYWAGWGETRGREQLRLEIIAWRHAFPDWSGKIEATVVEGDLVVVRLTAGGTFLGPLGEIEPNRKQVQIAEMAIFRLDNGRIIEHWEMSDVGSLERQLNIKLPDFGTIRAWK